MAYNNGFQTNRGARGAQRNRSGIPPARGNSRPRDVNRMANQRVGQVWDNNFEVDERDSIIPRRQGGAPRAQQPTVRNDAIYNYYDGDTRGSRPTTTRLGQNFDFSGFAGVLEKTYSQCKNANPRMSRELPFCMYQHAHVEILNAYLISHQKFENADERFGGNIYPLDVINARDVVIHRSVYEYIQGIGKALTPTGERVRVNLPIAGTPKPACDGMVSGSFGPVTAINHNAYECYFSPYISRRLIERTLEMNTAAIPNFGSWNPFPPENIPNNAVPNSNLLGYYKPDKLNQETINLLQNCNFQNGPTITGLLSHSEECMFHTTSVLSRLRAIDLVRADFKETENPAASPAPFIFKVLHDNVGYETRIASYNATLKCPYSFIYNNRTHFFVYKRLRTLESPGSCFTTKTGGELPNFVDHMNSNFTSTEPFGLQNQMVDRPSLREENHSMPDW